MTWILTHSGMHFDYTDPQPDMIDILDIANGLSNECRYAGQAKHFYSVAQHSVLVCRCVDSAFCLEALLHDAAEAYCKDIPRPLKALLPDYQFIEQRVELAIRQAFGLPAKQSDEVHHADRVLLATEKRDLMPDDPTPWPILEGITPLHATISPVYPGQAYMQFLRCFDRLTGSTLAQDHVKRLMPNALWPFPVGARRNHG